MNGTGKARWARVASLFLMATTLLLAALLIWQCADVFRTGTAPENLTESGVYIHQVYSREIVAERLGRIAWAVGLFVLALIATLALRTPAGRVTLTAPVENRWQLLVQRAEPTEAMRAQRRYRRLAGAILGLVELLCAAMMARYILTPGRFESIDLEAVVGALVLNLLPWTLLALAALMVFAQLRHRSMLREIELARQAPRKAAEPAKPEKPFAKNALRVALLAAAVVLIGLGVQNGGMFDVLVKAINICTECIGLG